ncbi:hypothetical protein BH10ACI3_BH10ACI3_23480 [soil metagenome]
MVLSIYIGSSNIVNAGTPSANPAGQIVPQTKRISKKVYRKGRSVTTTTYYHGKKYTKKAYSKGRWVTVTTWRHGKKYTKKVWRKGHYIVMGPPRRNG